MGDNQGVFAHCVADLGDHFRKELGLHSEHQHIGRFGNLAIAGGDGDAELLGALLRVASVLAEPMMLRR